MSRLPLVGCCLIQLVVQTALAETQVSDRSFEELTKIAQASKVQYEVHPVLPDSEAGGALLEQAKEPPGEIVRFPRLRREADGRMTIEEWRCKGEARVVLEEAEQAFVEQDLVTARQAYLRTLELDPECYMAHAHIGDTFFRENNPAAAIGPYSRAIEINPLDHRSFTYRGHAYVRIGQSEKALADFETALVLRPHYWLVANLIDHYGDLAMTLEDLRFLPLVTLLRTRGEGKTPDRVDVTVLSDPEKPDLLASSMPYALCRAVWLGEGWNGEPSPTSTRTTEESRKKEDRARRKNKKKQKEDDPRVPDSGSFFDAREEAACLAATLDAVEPGQDPRLDLLREAAAAGFLEEAVVYGIGAQRFGQLTLMMGEPQLDRLREFVSRFVLVPRARTEDSTGDPSESDH